MKTFIYTFLLVVAVQLSHAQITIYNTSNTGLLSNNISAIAMDSQNNIWFANYETGVTKYDNSTWTTYTTANSGLIHQAVHILAVDAQDNIWIGTWEGLSKFDGTTWTNYNTANGLVGNNVLSIAFDTHGNKWIGTSGGVSKFNGTTWTNYTLFDSGLADSSVYAIAIDSADNKWFGTMKGISKFDDVNWTTYLSNQEITSIAVDTQNRIWVGTGTTPGGVPQMGAFMFDGNNWTSYLVGEIYTDTIIKTVVIDPLGNIWFGGDMGVSMYDGSTFTIYNNLTTPGFTGNNFKSIAFDSQGNKWFGHNYGVIVLSNCGVPLPKDICYVEFDTTTAKNKITWDGNLPVNIDSIKIYNETSTNVWTLIGTVPATQNHFIDMNSNPFNQSYSYKIAALDTCGNISDFSTSHTTITLLAAYDQGSNAYGFTWSPYQGLPVANYLLYGIMANGTQTLIGSVPGNQYFYNYTNPYAGFVHYLIGFNTSPCGSKTDYLIKSNWVQTPSAIEKAELNMNDFLIYPNPSDGNMTITNPKINNGIYKMLIKNAKGELVLSSCFDFSKQNRTINLNELNNGIYFITLQNNNKVFSFKIIVQ